MRYATTWEGSTVYIANDKVINNGRKYNCTTGGTSAASVGPTGLGATITDGTAVWEYVVLVGLRASVIPYGKDKKVFKVPGGAIKEISDTNVFQWTDSPTTPGEYYLEKIGGGNSKIIHWSQGVDYILMEDGVIDEYIEEGTLGALTDHQWAVGDQDTLGYDTIYIKDVSGLPDSSAGRKFWLDNAVTNIESMTQAFQPLVTTTVKHGIPDGAAVGLYNIMPDALAADPGYSNNMERGIRVNYVSDYSFTLERDNRGYNAFTSGYVIATDCYVWPSGYNARMTRAGWLTTNTPMATIRIAHPDIHYVRVIASAGNTEATIKSLNIAVLNPKSDIRRYDTNYSNDNELAVGMHISPNQPTSSVPLSGDNTPTLATGGPIVPQYFGQMYIDTNLNKVYMATSLSSPPVVADWSILN